MIDYTDNWMMQEFEPYATADIVEVEDLAPPLSITEAAEQARRFLKNLPDDLIDADLGEG